MRDRCPVYVVCGPEVADHGVQLEVLLPPGAAPEGVDRPVALRLACETLEPAVTVLAAVTPERFVDARAEIRELAARRRAAIGAPARARRSPGGSARSCSTVTS